MTAMTAIVLAAGRGSRMGTSRPKVLHRLCGTALIEFPIRAAQAAGAERIVVVTGYRGAEVRAHLEHAASGIELIYVDQREQRGTGHAVRCALPHVPRHGVVALLSGDVPLLSSATLHHLLATQRTSGGLVGLCSFRPKDPSGYGRIIRDALGRVQRIVEDRDATPAQRMMGECNAGTYVVNGSWIHEALPRVGLENVQGEMYLTDLVALAAKEAEIGTVSIDVWEAAGVNTPEQLAALERHLETASRA